jgi:predicted aldo/keto reductase-like oxidoreductase
MSSEEQLRDNLSIFRTEAPLSPAETELLTGLARGMTAGVPCTACHYCVDHCPMGIDIPKMIALYNEHRFSGGGFLAPMALMAVPEENRPSACLSCGSCAAVCPQQIDIPSVMSDFAARLAR